MVHRIFHIYRDAYSGLSRPIWFLSLIMLLNRAGTMVMVFFVLYLTDVFNFSNRTAGLIISASAVGGVLGALVGGKASDRFGSIRSQILFQVLVSVQLLVLMVADSLFGVTAGLFVLMFFNEAIRPGLGAACFEFSKPENQKRSMGLLRLTINLGMAIGPVIGGFLAEYHLWNWLFIIDSLTCFLSAGLLLVVFGWNPRPEEVAKTACRSTSDRPVAESRTNTSVDQPTGRATSPWRDKRMLQFGFFYLLTLIVFVQISSSFIKYLEEAYGMSESQIGLLTAINPILIVLFEMVLIRRIEKFSTLRTIAIGALLICLGFGLLPFGGSRVYCALTIVIWTVGEILAFPMATVYVAKLSPPATRGQYMGFNTVLFSISMIVGPALGLGLYEINMDYPWYGALVLGAVTSIAFWTMSRMKRASLKNSSEPIDCDQGTVPCVAATEAPG